MNQMQELVQDFSSKHNLHASKNARLLDLVSETGELAKEFLKATSCGQREDFINGEVITLEFGDLVFSLLALANSLGINIQDALHLALEKHEQRIEKNNTPSS